MFILFHENRKLTIIIYNPKLNRKLSLLDNITNLHIGVNFTHNDDGDWRVARRPYSLE